MNGNSCCAGPVRATSPDGADTPAASEPAPKQQIEEVSAAVRASLAYLHTRYGRGFVPQPYDKGPQL